MRALSTARSGHLFQLWLFLVLTPNCFSRDLRLSLVDVRISEVGDKYSARIAIETNLDQWMVGKAAWQIYHRSQTDDVLYQVPVNGVLNSNDLNVTSFVGQQTTRRRSGVSSLLQATSNGREMALSYVYSVADQVSRTGISLTEFIDTERTKASHIPIERYNARERDVIQVYVNQADTGREYIHGGETMRLVCSYKTKYYMQRQWTWERTAALEDVHSTDVHPLEYTTIAKSRIDGSHVTHLGEYHVTSQEIEAEDGYVFVTELILDNFDENRHSAIYHCIINDWSMAARQPWLLTVDKFIEVASPSHQTPVDPSVLFPPGKTYVAIETCSKKGPDEDGNVILNGADPDCIVCLSLGHTTPILVKDGASIPRAQSWPLTVRNPYLHLIYAVIDRPSKKDEGVYTCTGSVFQHTPHGEVSMTIKHT